jgi:hypothetical protein
MERKNRYGGRCGNCGRYVPAGQGLAYRCGGSSIATNDSLDHYDCGDDGEGAWHVKHNRCQPANLVVQESPQDQAFAARVEQGYHGWFGTGDDGDWS